MPARNTYVVLFLLLSACVSKEELLQTKPNEVTVVMNLQVQMDGNEEGGMTSSCGAQLDDVNNKISIGRKDRDTYYYVYKVPAGKVTMSAIGCMANKIFYNKTRRYDLKDMYFIAQPGSINYVGDLRVEWSSERFKVGDLLLSGAGSITNDEGTLHMVLQNRMDEAKSYMQGEYNTGDKPFTYTPFIDHPLLTK
jgi:hypothetical protein